MADERAQEEMMESVKAAMMEELGIARKDTLPLEDRGGPINQAMCSLLEERKRAAATSDNPWLNAVFDDVPEQEHLLDSIADGQLYRMRRSIPGNDQGQNGNRGGGRGRGTGRAGRGGYTGTSSRMSEASNMRTPPPRGNSRRGRAADRMEDTVARLRQMPSRVVAAESVGRSHQTTASPRQTNRSTARSQGRASQSSSMNFQRPVTLVDPESFFAAAQHTTSQQAVDVTQTNTLADTLAQSSTLPTRGGLKASKWAPVSSEPCLDAASTSRSLAEALNSVEPPLRSDTNISDWAESILQGENNACVPVTQSAVKTDSILNNIPTKDCRPATTDKNTLRIFAATAQKGDDTKTWNVNVRLHQLSKSHPVVLEIEEKAAENKILFEGSIAVNSLLEIMENDPRVITFCNVSPIVRDLIWTVRFILPQYAVACYSILTRDPLRPVRAECSNTVPPLSSKATPPSHEQDGLMPVSTSTSGVAPESYSPLKISSQTLRELKSLETLIDFDDEDSNIDSSPQDLQELSALGDLAFLNDDYTVLAVLAGITKYYEGPFLDTLFDRVEDSNIARDARKEEVLRSDKHLRASEELVCEYFRQSETFSRLNEAEERKYLEVMGWKLLAKALLLRDNSAAEAAAEGEGDPCFAQASPLNPPIGTLNQSLSFPDDNDLATELEKSVKEHRVEESTANVLEEEGKPPIRITYSIDELLILRNRAATINKVLLSREDMSNRYPIPRSNVPIAQAHPRSNQASGNFQGPPQGIQSESNYGQHQNATSTASKTQPYMFGQAQTAESRSVNESISTPSVDGSISRALATKQPVTSVQGWNTFSKRSNLITNDTPDSPKNDRTMTVEIVEISPDHVSEETEAPTNTQVSNLARSFRKLNLESDEDLVALPTVLGPGLSASRWATKPITSQTCVRAIPRSSRPASTFDGNITYGNFPPRSDIHLRQPSNESSDIEALSSFSKAINVSRGHSQQPSLQKSSRLAPVSQLPEDDSMQSILQSRLNHSLSLR
ncbi:hypothetical protein GLAREA_08958 [Glarea lozoyensis ATCC 20868]|uniref:Uncharacterized protein n=1 Tax=Glarea lozoyensis (strain ATCC 20868 / MF5171) TaxID=1116229 RepID=S3DGJ8_GLAL2|nr:uncharacterized protein GLAREA_08958 [Glarea lozoyensis ATCC 20868]EPE36795.1 hypothetical protein GLAREA_08958 [Glarea lozoyensis ATCC 20868]